MPSYGLLVALAFAVGTYVTYRLALRVGLPGGRIMDLAVYCALIGMLGAKLFMFLFDWQYYAQNPGEIFTLSTLRAAGVFQGGFLLSFAFAFWFMRQHQLPALKTADIFTPGLALGHAIGRIGCLAAGCCFGEPTNLPWAVTYTDPHADGPPLNVPLHPSQLYEAAGNVVIFLLLLSLTRKPWRPGTLLGIYLVTYSLLRFAVEFSRKHLQDLPFGLPFSLTQWISLGTLAVGLGILWYSRRESPTREAVA